LKVFLLPPLPLSYRPETSLAEEVCGDLLEPLSSDGMKN
jgi:hypothetical protein